MNVRSIMEEKNKPRNPEPVYIIDDEDEDSDEDDEEEEEEDENIIDDEGDGVRESESQSEQFDSDYYEKPAYVHRKSVSFDFSSDERGKSDHERSRTPESSSKNYDSEQELSSRKMPRKGILRSASPSSSNSSTMEKHTRTIEKTLPIVPTVARIKEIESPIHYQRSPSPGRSVRSRSRSPPPPTVVEQVPVLKEIEQENPFREAFLHKNSTDNYTEMAKVISRSPNMLSNARQQFFSSKSNDDLLANEAAAQNISTNNLNLTKSLEKLNSGIRSNIKPPPPPKPKTIKKADIVRNLALETFQNTDMGQADITVYEHDATANIIHEICSRTTTPTPTASTPSPKLPVRILTRAISRPRESPPLPPINYGTLPKALNVPATSTLVMEDEYMEVLPPLNIHMKHAEEHHENSTDNILLTEEEHRDLMLGENELRNQLKRTIHNDEAGVPEFPAPPLPLRGSSKHLVNEFSSSNDTLDSWPVMHKNHMNINNFHKHNNGLSLSTNYLNSTNITHTNMQPQKDNNHEGAAAPLLATQIFPSAQILPVQYTQLPQPQQSYVNVSNIPKFSLGSYVLIPQTQFATQNPSATATPTLFLSGQGTQQVFQFQQQQQQIQQQLQQQPILVSDMSRQVTSPISPSYTSMQFPSLSEVKTPTSVFKFPPLPPTPNIDRYENMPLVFDNDTINSSTFSLNSSMNSLSKSANAASYYETAEQIYSIIQEDGIYSNTSFFDSRRSSDTSLNRLSLTSTTMPPPLPPKKPGGYLPVKFVSQSQPDLKPPAPKNYRPKTKLVATGKETTV